MKLFSERKRAPHPNPRLGGARESEALGGVGLFCGSYVGRKQMSAIATPHRLQRLLNEQPGDLRQSAPRPPLPAQAGRAGVRGFEFILAKNARKA